MNISYDAKKINIFFVAIFVKIDLELTKKFC